MRKSVALIVAAGLLVALAGCSTSTGDAAASCTPTASAGDASKLITATGDFDKKPTISVSTPLYATKTETSVLIQGSGAPAVEGGLVIGELSIIDGTTGAVLQESSYDGSNSSSFIIGQTQIPGLNSGLQCVRAGSRVAIAIPASDGVGADAAKSAGIGADDTLAVVFDVTNAYPSRASGAIQPAQAGFPSVALGPDGRPGITIPSGMTADEAKSAVLIKGSGDTIAEGDSVLVKYTEVSFDDKSVTKSTWADGSPVSASASTTAPLTATIVPNLVGQTIGSQYISIVPKATDSTGAATPAQVFVVDVLGVLPKAAAQ